MLGPGQAAPTGYWVHHLVEDRLCYCWILSVPSARAQLAWSSVADCGNHQQLRLQAEPATRNTQLRWWALRCGVSKSTTLMSRPSTVCVECFTLTDR
jgi:hypothetical protein